MTKTKSTKRALLSSVLALVLCLTMFVGSTFAWFTDTASTGINTIQSGNLDVVLEYLDGDEWKDAKGLTLNFQKAAGAEGEAVLWEPGCTYELPAIRVRNNGNLALKYQLIVNGVKGDAKLLEAIDWTVEVGDKDAVALATLEDYLTAKGTEKEASEAIVIIGHMKEEAGNEYQDKTIEGLGITVVATQYNYESDSFDNLYDANLEFDPDNDGLSRTLEDGSTVFFFNEESGFGGRVRLLSLPENLGSEYVVPAVVNDLGGALVGVTLDKLTVPAGIEHAQKALNGSTIKEVVIEEGTTVIPNRLFYKTNVESVVIPSTVTTIEQSAFSQATAKTLVIPASVTTLENDAFAYMPNLETVVFEGDATLPTYLFRACPKLATVEIKGDVTVATTSMVFSNYETGGKDDMTFYVSSAENAEELISCLGAYNDTNTGKDRNKWTVYVGETVLSNAKNVSELQKALDNATKDTIINLTADITGDVTVKKNANVDLVIDGKGKKFTGVMNVIGDTDTGSLTVKNVNFVAATGKTAAIFCPEQYTDGRVHNNYVQNVTIENCTFTDLDDSLDCVAISQEGNGQKNWTLKGCTVESSMHSFMQVNNIADSFVVDGCKVYSKNGLNVNQSRVLTVIGSTFDVTGYAIRCGAKSGGDAYAETYLIKGCTLKSACAADDDAVIVLRATSDNATLTIEETTLVGTRDIINNATNVTINR